MTRRSPVMTALALVVVVLTGDGAAAQCAMCKTLLATPEGQAMIAGLRSGILLLLAAPFAVFATVATLAVRAQRRRRAAATAGAGRE